MNKIYKVVWSKVKNCYVVVSEIAKNVITGAVKSAKVGSSVASGLAMGALMAFVITGNAMAAAGTIELGSIYPTEQIDEKYSASDKLIVEYSVYDQHNSKIVLESGGDTSIGSIYAKSKSDITVDSVGNTTIGSVNSAGYGGQININSGETTTTGGITISNSNGGGDTINVGGKNISIDAGTGDGVSVRGGYSGFSKETTANIGTVETENVDIKGSYGLLSQYEHSDINVYGKELNIEATERGIYTGNNSECYTPSAEVNVYSDHTKITMAEGKNALVAFSDSTLNIHGGLEVTAKDAIMVRGQSTVNVNAAGEGVVKLDGNVNFNNQYGTGVHVGANNNVNINMTTEDSYLNGAIYVTNSDIQSIEKGDKVDGVEQTYRDVGVNGLDGMKLGMSNGATWNVTDDSFVNNLYGTDAKLTGEDVEVVVYNREDEAGVAVTNSKLDIAGVDLVIDTEKTAIYNQDITIKSDSDVTIKSQQQGISAYGDVVIEAANVTIKSVDNGIQSVADANPNDVGNVTIKATEDVNIKATDKGYAVTNVSKNGGVINISGQDVTLVSENRTAVKVGHEVGEAGYNGTVNVTGANITIEGAAKEAIKGQYRQSAAVLAQGSETKLNLNASDAITIKNTGITNKGSAIGAYDGATIEVAAGGDVSIAGQVNAWQQTTVDISGKNVTLANDGADTVRGVGATINITADDDINITTVEKDGIQACASDVNLTAKNVVIDADAWGINVTADAGSNVAINAENIEITGADAEDKDMGAIRNLAASEVILNASNSIVLTGDVYVANGGSVALDASGSKAKNASHVKVEGNILAEGQDSIVEVVGDKVEIGKDASERAIMAGSYNDAKNSQVKIEAGDLAVVGQIHAVNDGVVTIDATKVTLEDATTNGALYAYSGDITVNAAEVDVSGKYRAIKSDGDGVVSVNANKVTVSTESGWAVTTNPADGKTGGVVITAKDDLIVNAAYGISSSGGGDIELNAENAYIDANIALSAQNGNVKLNTKGITQVNGAVRTLGTGTVSAAFAGPKSYLDGKVTTSDGGTTKLAFADGATWYADGDDKNKVTNLDMQDGNIVIEDAKAGSITVGTLTGSSMHVELASGKAEVGTVVVDKEDANSDGVEDEDVRVSVTTNGVAVNASVAKGYKGIVQTKTGKGIVDEINAKDTFISGDVKFKADKDGNMQVVSTTLNGDVNVTGTINGVDVTNAGGLERNAASQYYQTTTIEGKTTIDSMGRVYTNYVFADQAIVVGDHSTFDSTGLYVGENFKVDKETGDVEAGKVNGAEISDYMFNGVVLDKDGDVMAKDVMATGGITAIGNITSLQGVKAAGGKFVVDGATGNVTGGTYNGVNVENLKDQVDANIGRIENVENRVTENEFAISQNKQDIATNAEKIETNNKLIAENRDAIADNAFNIESNKQAIADNEVAIETNKDAIEANKQAIEVNKDAIEANKDAIEANKQAIETNKADIAANKQAIADEAAAREAADKALSDAIDNVAGDIADTKAQVEDNKVAIAENKAAIEQNAQDLANEVADRVAADNKLQQKLDKESVDRQIADAQERAERAQADQELQNAIDAEEQARKDADAAEAKARSEEDQRIENKFDGEVNRLDNRIDKVDAKIDKVGAMAAAMASLKTMGYDPEAPTEIAVGIGQYRNETGIAIGAFHYPNKNFMLNFSLSTAGDEVMGGIGATWKIGRKR